MTPNFSKLLSAIDDLSEMKRILHAWESGVISTCDDFAIVMTNSQKNSLRAALIARRTSARALINEIDLSPL